MFLMFSMLDLLSETDTTPPLLTFLKHRKKSESESIPRPVEGNILVNTESPLKHNTYPEGKVNFDLISRTFERTFSLLQHKEIVNEIFKDTGIQNPSTVLNLTRQYRQKIPYIQAFIRAQSEQDFQSLYLLDPQEFEPTCLANLLLQKCLECYRSTTLTTRWYSPCNGNSNLLEEVVLPALLYRGAFIRPPVTAKDRNTAYALDLNYDDLTQIFANYGVVDRGDAVDCLLMINHLEGALPSQFENCKVAGSICFTIDKSQRICEVKSINIRKNYKRFGYATLLMNCAYKIAKNYQCTRLELAATEEGFPFYISLDFKPLHGNIPDDEWKKLSFRQKIHLLTLLSFSDQHPALRIDLDDMEIGPLWEKKISQALHPAYMKRQNKRPAIDLENLPYLPTEVKKWGLDIDQDTLDEAISTLEEEHLDYKEEPRTYSRRAAGFFRGTSRKERSQPDRAVELNLCSGEKGLPFLLSEERLETNLLKTSYRKRYRKELPVAMEISSWEIIANFTEEGLGIGFFPTTSPQEEKKSLVEYPNKCDPIPYKILAILPKSLKTAKNVSAFLDLLKQQLN